MNFNKLVILLFLFLALAVSCTEGAKETPTLNFAAEKAAIIKTLNDETKAAFQRDYEGWTKKWIHDPTITKTYLNFSDNSFSESMGWEEISNFVKNYIEDHPEPEPLPSPLAEVEVRLYGNGAWVTYEQQDKVRGRKRETRLMEKENGTWKIAGMQTTIYGVEDE